MAIDSRPIFKLIFKEGAEVGQEIELSDPEIVVGSESGSDILLSIPVVLRRHARLLQQGDIYKIKYLGSSSGVFDQDWLVSSRGFVTPEDFFPQIGFRCAKSP